MTITWADVWDCIIFFTLFFLVESLLYRLTHRNKGGTEVSKARSVMANKPGTATVTENETHGQVENGGVHLNLGLSYTPYTQKDKAELVAEELDGSDLLNECETCIAHGDYASAVTLLEWYRAAHPADVRAANMLLDSYYELKDTVAYSQLIATLGDSFQHVRVSVEEPKDETGHAE